MQRKKKGFQKIPLFLGINVELHEEDEDGFLPLVLFASIFIHCCCKKSHFWPLFLKIFDVFGLRKFRIVFLGFCLWFLENTKGVHDINHYKFGLEFCLCHDSNMHSLLNIFEFSDSVSEYAVNGADLFLLSSKTGSLRKLTLFTLEKAVEKLHWRHCYAQVCCLLISRNGTIALPTNWCCSVRW